MRKLIKPLQQLLFVSSALLLCSTSLQADVFKWKDRYGKTQYGDQPPRGVKAQRVTMPALTVIENYGQQWRPVDDAGLEDNEPQDDNTAPTAGSYRSLTILAPKAGQGIRANDGDVTVMLSSDPRLKSGHSIVLFLDGKQVSNGTARAVNLPNLDRGEHSIRAEIRDAYNHVLADSGSLTFTVLRHSVLLNKTRNPATNPNIGYPSTGSPSPWPTR